MNRRDFLCEFLFGLGAAMTTSTFSRTAAADAIDDKLAAISRARAGAKTLTGPFTQVATVGLLRSQIQSTGKLYVQYPNRMRWELNAPDSVTYWIAPEGLAYRGLHGGGRIPANTVEQADVDALRAMLGGNVSGLRTRFDVHEIASVSGGPAFECTPKSTEQALRLRKLTFELDVDLVRPKSATIVYDTHNQTAITFGALQRDVPIDPAMLTLP